MNFQNWKERVTMEINLSDQTIKTVHNSLRASRQSLKEQLRMAKTGRKSAILTSQLEEMEDALCVIEELVEMI